MAISVDRIHGVAGDLAIKAPVRVATTANITLSGLQTIDGVVLVDQDRVLVKNQTTGADNGIWVATTSSWSRALDFNGALDVVQGTFVRVTSGTTNQRTMWELTTASPVVGTSSLTFALANDVDLVTALAGGGSGQGAGLSGFSHAATYAEGTVGAKLKDWVNVKDAPYNCKVDGSTDDTAGYQAALNDAKCVFIPPGTLIHGNIVVPTGGQRTVFSWSRNAATLKLKNSVNVNGHTIANANDIEFRCITLDGNKANNLVSGNGLLISGTSTRVRCWDVHIKDWRESAMAGTSGVIAPEFIFGRISGCGIDGFQGTTVDQPAVMFSTIEDNGRYGSVFGSACTNVRDFGNFYQDNAGGGSVMVGGNDAIRMGNIADNNGTGHGLQYNNVLRGVYTGNISKNNGISGLDFTLGSSYGVAVGNISFANDVRGVEIDSASFYVTATGNVVYRNGEVGMSVYRSPTTILVGNHSLENGVTTAPRYGFRFWDDAGTLPSANCVMLGNNGSDDRGGSATQTHGVSMENNSTLIALIGNKLSPNVTAATNAVNATSVQNAGEGNLGIDIESTTLTLAAGWVEYDANWTRPIYHKDAAGMVTVSGVMKNGTVTAGTVIATLPAGFRPLEVEGPFVCFGEAGNVSFYVLANGDITANSALNATRTSLDGISFRVA